MMKGIIFNCKVKGLCNNKIINGARALMPKLIANIPINQPGVNGKNSYIFLIKVWKDCVEQIFETKRRNPSPFILNGSWFQIFFAKTQQKKGMSIVFNLKSTKYASPPKIVSNRKDFLRSPPYEHHNFKLYKTKSGFLGCIWELLCRFDGTHVTHCYFITRINHACVIWSVMLDQFFSRPSRDERDL